MRSIFGDSETHFSRRFSGYLFVVLNLVAATALGLSNLINSSDGINGLLFDISDLRRPDELSVSDFIFQVSPTAGFFAIAFADVSAMRSGIGSELTVITIP